MRQKEERWSLSLTKEEALVIERCLLYALEHDDELRSVMYLRESRAADRVLGLLAPILGIDEMP